MVSRPKADMVLTSSDTISEESVLEKSAKALSAKRAVLYAVQSKCNDALEIARGTYTENVKDINDCKSSLPQPLLTHIRVRSDQRWVRKWC